MAKKMLPLRTLRKHWIGSLIGNDDAAVQVGSALQGHGFFTTSLSPQLSLSSLLSSPSPSFSSRGSPLRRRCRCVQFRPGLVRAWHVPRERERASELTLWVASRAPYFLAGVKAAFWNGLVFRQHLHNPLSVHLGYDDAHLSDC